MPNIIPNPGETFASFYNRYGRSDAESRGSSWVDADPYSLGAKFQNAIMGTVDSARDVYDTWYNEQSAAKKAQADYEYTRMLNSTKYQDEVKALRDAGLNPYAILSGNGLSAGNMSYSNSEAPSRSHSNTKSNVSSKAIGAIAIIVAALIKAVV